MSFAFLFFVDSFFYRGALQQENYRERALTRNAVRRFVLPHLVVNFIFLVSYHILHVVVVFSSFSSRRHSSIFIPKSRLLARFRSFPFSPFLRFSFDVGLSNTTGPQRQTRRVQSHANFIISFRRLVNHIPSLFNVEEKTTMGCIP